MKKSKRSIKSQILSIVLAICMVVPGLLSPLTVQAAENTDPAVLEVQEAEVQEEELQEEVPQEEPVQYTGILEPGTYLLTTAEEVPTEIPEGVTLELANDITLQPGQQIATVAGVLDGKGYTITLADKPLIAEATGTIQNLNVAGALTSNGVDYRGSIVTFLNGGTVQNSSSRVDITLGMLGVDGGIVGRSENGKVYNSFYSGNVTLGILAECGGVIGQSNQETAPSEIKNCYYAGTKDSPVNFGNAYNKDDSSYGLKTVEQLKASAALLNVDIADTGYTWAATEGGLPALKASSTQEGTDFTQLSAKVDEVKAMNKDDYVPETWTAVEEALAAAEEVLLNEEASQKEVNDVLAALTTAVDALKKPLPTTAVALPAEEEINKITSFADIKKIGTGEGKYYRLENDITVKASDWYYEENTFNGIIDGAGHTVTFENSSIGLFAEIGENAVVQNMQFAGTMTGKAAPVGNVAYGSIINCLSKVEGSDAVGLVKRLGNGVISNCVSYGKPGAGAMVTAYGGDNYSKPDGAKYVGKIHNSYWLNGANEPAYPPEDLIGGSGSRKEKDMQQKAIVIALNEKRGEYGVAWGQNGKTGFPYFGVDQDFDPDRIDLPENKYVVKFGTTAENAEVIADQKLEVSRTDLVGGGNSIIGQFFVEGVESKDVEWSVYDVVNDAIDINKQTGTENNGKLHIFKDGEGIVKGRVNGEDAIWVKVFVSNKQMEDIKLFIVRDDDKEKVETDVTNSNYTLKGSEWARIKVKAKYKGESEYKNAYAGSFHFKYEDGEMVHNEGTGVFHFNYPGTSSVTIESQENSAVKATVQLTSEFVPITSVRPDLSEFNYLHARSSMGDGRMFDAIETNGVIIEPSNASNKKGFDVTSSNPEVAVFTATLPLGYLTYGPGTTTLTATMVDKDPTGTYEKTVTGTRTVEFQYKNPLTKINVNSKDVTVKAYETTALDIDFEGELSKDGWSVTEPELIWTFSGNGAVKIKRDPLHVQHRNEGGVTYPEGEAGYWMASTDYIVEGTKAGTVVATGTPVDKTNNVEPVTINITVTPGEVVEVDYPALIKKGKDTGLAVLRKKHETTGYNYADEWDVYEILRAGETLTEEEINGYYDSVVAEVKTWNKNKKPTDIERVALALAAIGKDIKNVGGVNLVDMLANHKNLTMGSNELTYALIALDAAGEKIPAGQKWTRDSIIEELLKFQNEDGGIALFPNGGSGIDTTAMTLQSLAPYKDRPEVQAAIDKGLDYLRKIFESKLDSGTSEANAQVILALTVLGMDPLTAEGFSTPNENMILTLMDYHVDGEGFRHVPGGKVTDMSVVQAYQALDSYERFVDGKTTYWDLQGDKETPEPEKPAEADAVIKAINELPQDITLDDKAAVEAARKAYDALTKEQQALVTNIDKLTAAEKKLTELNNLAKADVVIKAINELPKDITADDKAAVEAARKAYDALTKEQKELVTNLDVLVAAEKKLEESVKPEKATVTFSVERFTIGQGYLVEPVTVEVMEGDPVVSVIKKVLGADRLDLNSGDNYLAAIKDADLGTDKVVVPQYITDMSNGSVTTESVREYGNEDYDPGTLGEFSYHYQSGWFYFLNNVDPGIGIGQQTVKDGDVIRLQFTLYGLGKDLTGKGYGESEQTIVIESKDSITTLMAQVNGSEEKIKNNAAVKAAYADAVKAVSAMITSKEDLVKAEEALAKAVKDAENAKPVTGWAKDGNYDIYIKADGTKATSEFLNIDGKRYYFDAASHKYATPGFKAVGTIWYYFNADGSVVKGFKAVGSVWYYFNNNGEMLKGWQQVDGYWYYFNGSGAMHKGWLKSGSNWFYFNGSGHMMTGWQAVNGKWYYFYTSGRMLMGWQKIDGHWYYLKSSGEMTKGWYKEGVNWFYFNGSGHMMTGWQAVNGKWYYFYDSGRMITGWQKIDGHWYYLKSSGEMTKGWFKEGRNWFYFNGSGHMVTGWQKLGVNWFYFKSNGVMAANEKIGNYYFNASGAWVK